MYVSCLATPLVKSTNKGQNVQTVPMPAIIFGDNPNPNPNPKDIVRDVPTSFPPVENVSGEKTLTNPMQQ